MNGVGIFYKNKPTLSSNTFVYLHLMDIKAIYSSIEAEMQHFEQVFVKNMSSNVGMLDKVTHYIVKRKGKQMRPMFLFLTAKMLGEINQKTYQAASMIELLHTATLVHDDVVDDANERRGFYSVNALWKNKIAVLVGDFFLSKVLLLSIENNQTRFLEITARAVKEMSEGELLQIEKARRMDISEELYFEVIRKKTASLIESVCEIAAVSVDREDEAQNMRKFGELVGLAFQIKDDIFDYGTSDVGKPTGLDIRERKVTLPLIYVLQNSSKEIRKELINIVKNHNEEKEKVKRAVELVMQEGGVDYAYKRMNELREQALDCIKNIPNSEAKEALIGLVNYTIERTR